MNTSRSLALLVSLVVTMTLCGCGSEERSGRGDSGPSKPYKTDASSKSDAPAIEPKHEETVDAQVNPLKKDAFVVPKESGPSMFGDLFAVLDARDPCFDAFPWQPKLTISMKHGDFVTYGGKLYEYVGEKEQDWAREDCTPGEAAGFDCAGDKWWKDTETTCP